MSRRNPREIHEALSVLEATLAKLREERDDPDAPPLPPRTRPSPMERLVEDLDMFHEDLDVILATPPADSEWPSPVLVTSYLCCEDGLELRDPPTMLDLLSLARLLERDVYMAATTTAIHLDLTYECMSVGEWAPVAHFMDQGRPIEGLEAVPLATLLRMREVWFETRQDESHPEAYRAMEEWILGRAGATTIAPPSEA